MCNCKFRRLSNSVQIYSEPKDVTMLGNVNAISVRNEGTTNVIFQNDTIEPGTFKSINCNANEILDIRADIWFQVPTPAPATIINKAVVTQLYYVISE
jgi:hypothetical protein